MDVSCKVRNFKFIFAFIFLFASSAFAANFTTYQAKIVKPDGYPLEATNVNFKFTILNPAGNCILYSETYSAVNMASTGGVISFSLGSGVKTYPASSTTFFDIFNNGIANHSCDTGGPGNYSPGANDTRKIVMQFHDGTGWQTLPAMTINAVPYAMYANDAQSLGGVSAANYVRYSTIPTCGASQALQFNGASFNCVTMTDAGNFTASDVTAALSYTPANAASLTALDSAVGSVSSTVSAVSSSVYAVSSTVSSLTSSMVSFQNTVAVSLAAITSSQWTTSGSAVFYNTGNVGVGTSSPVTKLDVAGGLRISMEASACAANLAGTLRYNGGNVEYCNGTTWAAFGVSGSGMQGLNGSTSGTQTFATGTAGTAPAFSTANGVHTLNIPLASAGSVTGGLLSNADYTTFMGKITSSAASIAQVLGYAPVSATTLNSYVLRANNLSDLTSSATARTNLGVGYIGTLTSVDLSSADVSGTLAIARTPSYTGDVTKAAASNTLVLSNTGVVAGTYNKVTVDAKGRVTSSSVLTVSDVTTALGYTPASASASTQWVTSGSTINYGLGNVGIGTVMPVTKLEVSGGLRISMEAAACTAGLAGTLRYSGGNVEFCNGSSWSAFGVAAAGVNTLNGSASQTQSFSTGTTGTALNISSVNGVHTFNIPLASTGAVTAGLLSNADYTTFMGKITSSAASIAQVLGYVPASATALSGYVVRANNLSDLTSSATARTNLGVGYIGTLAAVDLGSADVSGTLAIARTPAYAGDVTKAAASNTLILSNTGVTAGTYTKVTVDAKGRVTSSTSLASVDVTTALGYTPASASAATQWVSSGSAIGYTTGAVGVGTTSPNDGRLVIAHTASGPSVGLRGDAKLAFNGGLPTYGQGPRLINLYPSDTVDGHGIGLSSGMTEFYSNANFGFFVRSNRADINGSYTSTEILRIGVGGVGVGTTAPVTKLDVAGGLRISMEPAGCSVSYAGTLRYNGGNVEYCNGSSWSAFGVAAAGVNTLNGSASQTQSFSTGTTGTALNISSVNGVHTFNIPLASTGAVTAGLLSNADYTTFMGKITSSAASIAQVLGYVPASATALSGYVVRANNLSDLTSSATARTNLGVGYIGTLTSVDLGSADVSGTLAIARTPAYTGDVTKAVASNTLILSNTGVTAGTYNKVTVDAKGRVTSSSALTVSDVTTALGYTPASATASSQWTTNGSMIHYNLGNVGIGVSSPATKLSVNGQIGAAYGNVSNPSYSFIGDTSTGFYSSSFGNLRASVSGIDRIAINGSDIRVGGNLNTSDYGSESKFVIVGSENGPNTGTVFASLGFSNASNQATQSASEVAKILISAQDTTANHARLEFQTKDGTNLTTRMLIDKNGLVGIGTTTPTAKLQISPGTTSVAPLRLTSGALLTSPVSGAVEFDGSYYYITDGANTRRAIATVASPGTFDNASTITSTGNITMVPVGSVIVSSTTPSTSSNTGALIVNGGLGVAGNTNINGSLNVVNSIAVSGAIYGDGNIHTGGGNRGFWMDTPGNYNYGLWRDSGDNVHLRAGGVTDRLTISNSTGNIGIGTSNPSMSLEIYGGSGSNGSNGIKILSANSSGNNNALLEAIGKRSDGNIAGTFAGTIALAKNRTDAAIGTGSHLGRIVFGGNHTDGSLSNIRYTATLAGVADGSFSSATSMPTAIAFFTGSNGVSTATTAAAGNERMRISSTGLVGIGTTSPSARLHIASGTTATAPLKFSSGTLLTSPESGTMEYDGLNFYLTDGAGARKAIAQGASPGTIDSLSNINSTGHITLTPVGSVVVSATTASTNSSTGALIVNGGLGVAGSIYASGSIVTSSVIQGASMTATNGIISPYIAGSTVSGGSITIDSTTHASKGKILLNGNVGLGIANPDDQIHMSKVLKFTNVIGTTNYKAPTADSFRIFAHDDAGTGNMYGTSDNNAKIFENVDGNNPTPDDGFFFVNHGASGPVIAMTILGNSNVGIGTSAPSAALEVGRNSASGSSFRFVPNQSYQSAFRFTADGNANWIQSGLDYTNDSKKDLKFSSINGMTTWMTVQASSGNLGIGTATPGSRLSVKSSGASTYPLAVDASTGSGGFLVQETSGNDYALRLRTTAGTDNVLLNTNGVSYFNGGNVGIGTSAPVAQLDISAGTAIGNVKLGYNGPTYGVFVDTAGTYAGSWARETSFGYGGSKLGSFGALAASATLNYLYITANQAGANSGHGSPTMVITPAGNVGVGTTAPASLLHVFGNNGGLRMEEAAGKYASVHTDSAGNLVLEADQGVSAASSRIAMNIDGSEKMRIEATGNVGINTSTPAQKLDVSGGIKAAFGEPTASNTSASGFSFDGDTGLFAAADGQLNLWSNNVRAVSVRNAKVGVGILAPTEELDVSGTVKATSFKGDGSLLTNISAASLTYYNYGSGYAGGVVSFAAMAQGVTGYHDYTGTATSAGTTYWAGITTKNSNTGAQFAVNWDTNGGTPSGFKVRAKDDNIGDWTAWRDVAFVDASVKKTGDTMTGQLVLPSNGLSVGTSQLIVSAGSVGIGTVSPDSALNVVGTGGGNDDVHIDSYTTTAEGSVMLRRARGTEAVPTTLLANDRIGFYTFRGYDGSAFLDLSRIQATTEADLSVSASANLQFFTTYLGSTTEKIRISASGAVGVGTSTPTAGYRMDVFGDMQVGNGTSAQTIRFRTANSDAGFIRFNSTADSAGNSSLEIGTTDNNDEPITFTQTGNERMRIHTNGFVGIGTATPDDRLVVYNGSTTGRYTTGGWTHTSDARLKHDIKPLENSLNKVVQLRGVAYTYNNDPKNERQIGFLAQEVEPLFPQVVQTDKKGFKSMIYANLIAPVVEAIKELFQRLLGVEAKIKQQSQEIEMLKAKSSSLEEQNKALRDYLCEKDPKAKICQ